MPSVCVYFHAPTGFSSSRSMFTRFWISAPFWLGSDANACGVDNRTKCSPVNAPTAVNSKALNEEWKKRHSSGRSCRKPQTALFNKIRSYYRHTCTVWEWKPDHKNGALVWHQCTSEATCGQDLFHDVFGLVRDQWLTIAATQQRKKKRWFD